MDMILMRIGVKIVNIVYSLIVISFNKVSYIMINRVIILQIMFIYVFVKVVDNYVTCTRWMITRKTRVKIENALDKGAFLCYDVFVKEILHKIKKGTFNIAVLSVTQ